MPTSISLSKTLRLLPLLCLLFVFPARAHAQDANDAVAYWLGTKHMKTYRLADYTAFPYLQDYFTEIVKEVRFSEGKVQVLIIHAYSLPAFGDQALVLLDGVPMPDQQRIMTYPPEQLDRIVVYANDYLLDGRVVNGVVNLITKKSSQRGA